MMRVAILATLLCVVPQAAHADGRLNIRFDVSQANVKGAFTQVGLAWPGLEVELEKAFAHHKIVASGFAIGVRREAFYGFTAFGENKGVQRWDEGTYLTLRVYRSIKASRNNSWSINPSVALVYGIPGTTLDRTISTSRADGGTNFTHVFPTRNADVPTPLASQADVGSSSAMLYPDVSVSLRKRLVKGGINVEWIAGARRIRFGVIDSSEQGVQFDERREWTPSVGMRFGLRVF